MSIVHLKRALNGACERSDVLDAAIGVAREALAFTSEPQFVGDACCKQRLPFVPQNR